MYLKMGEHSSRLSQFGNLFPLQKMPFKYPETVRNLPRLDTMKTV